MSEKLNWHDAHALMLIDQALQHGRMTDEAVAQISEAFHLAAAHRERQQVIAPPETQPQPAT